MIKKEITVAILSYNCENTIGLVIESVENQKNVNFDIVIVDNASKDGSISVIEEKKLLYKNITLIQNKENEGYNIGKNKAVDACESNYIYLLDDDICLKDESTLSNLLEFYRGRDSIGFCSLPLRNKNEEVISHTGCFFSWYGQRLNKKSNIDNLAKQSFYRVGAPIGGNIFFAKKIWQEVGGYIPVQPFNFDDYYIGGLSWILGYNNYCLSSTIAEHLGVDRRSTVDSFANKFQYFLSGNLFTINILYKKNVIFSLANIIFVLVKALKNVFTFRSVKPILAYLRSLCFFVKNIRFVLEKRKQVQLSRVVLTDVFLSIQPEF